MNNGQSQIYDTGVNTIPGPFTKNRISVAVDSKMKVVFINQKGAELLGRDRRDIIGSDWFERFVPKELRVELRGRFEGLLQGASEPGPAFDFPVLAAEGVPRPVEWRLVVMKDDAGNRTGLFGAGEVRGGPAPA